jgi:uncharacterized protein
MMYKKSRFNLELSLESRKYLYNSYSGALAELDPKQYELYKSCDFQGLGDIQLWRDMGFLVPRNLNETKMLKTAFEKSRYRAQLYLTIAPTLLCNCACDYCYQDKNPITMQPPVYDAIRELIISSHGLAQREIPVAWYGGEPFLCLEDIAGFTREAALQIGHGKLHYTFVTNGTLFNATALESIRKHAIIKSFQVSLDGPRDYHDTLRIYRNGEGTYDDIIANLPNLAKFGHIVLRVNVDTHNQGVMDELFADLKAKLPPDLKPTIYFANIQRCNANVRSDPERYIGPVRFIETKLKLSRLAAKHGFRVENLPRCSMGCTYSTQNAFVIDPLGNCYKCWDFIGNPAFIIGNVQNFADIYQDAEYLRELQFNPYENQDCPQCNMLPLCKSGCPAIMNSDLPHPQEHLSCREIQLIYKKCIKQHIKFHDIDIQEVSHENIS